MRYFIAILMLSLTLTACGESEDKSTSQPDTTSTPQSEILSASPTPETDSSLTIPTLDPRLRPTFEAQYDELQAVQSAIEGIWSDLQAGENVACADELPFLPAPQNYEEEHPVASLLYSAAVSLDTAYSLWTAECNNPRAEPPPEIVNQGLLAALSAGVSLQSVADILQGN